MQLAIFRNATTNNFLYRYSIDKSEEQIISGKGSTGSVDPVLARVKR